MSLYQQMALFVTTLWLIAVAVWYRRSTPVLAGGLTAIGASAGVAIWFGSAKLSDFGLSLPQTWLPVFGWAAAWLVLMLGYSPLADRLASRAFAQAPTLGAFRAIQQSIVKLIAGIAIAWLLGAFLEELVFRGIVLNSTQVAFAASIGAPAANAIAVVLAALGATIIHLYQGPRAAFIIGQLSILFGALFVFCGFNLWAVILCHGLYDTIAFTRFAMRRSKYSNLDENAPTSTGSPDFGR